MIVKCAPVEIALNQFLFCARCTERKSFGGGGGEGGCVIPKLLRKPLEGEQALGKVLFKRDLASSASQHFP